MRAADHQRNPPSLRLSLGGSRIVQLYQRYCIGDCTVSDYYYYYFHLIFIVNANTYHVVALMRTVGGGGDRQAIEYNTPARLLYLKGFCETERRAEDEEDE